MNTPLDYASVTDVLVALLIVFIPAWCLSGYFTLLIFRGYDERVSKNVIKKTSKLKVVSFCVPPWLTRIRIKIAIAATP